MLNATRRRAPSWPGRFSRPYLEVGCLGQLGSVSEPHSFGTARRHCHEAIALAERHGWGAERVIAPALVTLADTMIWRAEFDEGERWLQRAARSMHITSDDQPADAPAIMGFRHAPVGTSSLNTIHSTSRLILPVIFSSGTPSTKTVEKTRLIRPFVSLSRLTS